MKRPEAEALVKALGGSVEVLGDQGPVLPRDERSGAPDRTRTGRPGPSESR
ncbi:MAG: hypothetical protein M0C28_21880 [Candidatus Moduliflexus flocculans]|nr:hypothetical protein [Candidatus Moduliflexus flocculans]